MRKELLLADILAVEESICQRVRTCTGAKSFDIHTLCVQKAEKNEERLPKIGTITGSPPKSNCALKKELQE